ncbi:MAG: putative quinol monooxygenase [Beutenbergiaceae bacterium]
MTAVVVTAIFRPKEGAKDALKGALAEGIPAVHAEPGCELYAIHDADDGTIVMLEKWTSAADLQAHSQGAAVSRLNELVEPHMAEPVIVTTMVAIPAGTPQQGLF